MGFQSLNIANAQIDLLTKHGRNSSIDITVSGWFIGESQYFIITTLSKSCAMKYITSLTMEIKLLHPTQYFL